MAEVVRLAKETGEPIEVTDDTGRVVTVVSVPRGPLPEPLRAPIDKVRELLASPPRPSNKHVAEAQRHHDAGLFGEFVGALALLDAIREVCRDA